MPLRFHVFALAALAAGSVLSGCAEDRRIVDRPAPALAEPDRDRSDETRDERYARGEYRRGFKHDAERNTEFCRLNPADTDCIGRRY